MNLTEELLNIIGIEYKLEGDVCVVGNIAFLHHILEPVVYDVRPLFSAYKNRKIHLYHITNNVSAIKYKRFIESKLHLLKRIGARETRAVELEHMAYEQFLEKHHIQGKTKSHRRVGLIYEGKLVAVAGTVNISGSCILNRLCYGEYSVAGGASKMIKSLEEEKIVSYSSNAYSDGNVYSSVGFVKIKESSSGMWYIDHHGKLLNRRGFQKKCLPSILKSFDETKTETQNMLDNGYGVYYGAGHMKWVLTQ